MQNTIDIIEWQKYIDYKKKLIIENINNTIDLDNSKDNNKFINILKSIINIKIFNVSNFSFLALKILFASSFINPIILSNIINNDYNFKQNKNNENENNNTNDTNDNNNTNDNNIKNILLIIIDFVVQIEISLNYNCILFSHFINKAKTVSLHNEKIQVYNTFNEINKNITKTINPSALILLFFKFLQKLSGNSKNNIFEKILNIEKENKSNIIIKSNINLNANNILKTNTNMKLILDTFMLKINKNLLIDANNTIDNIDNKNIDNENIYLICSKYIISIVELFYNNFNYLINILEAFLNLPEEKKKEFNKIKILIQQLINDEIKICKELFNL
jgi:hypothetical protein